MRKLGLFKLDWLFLTERICLLNKHQPRQEMRSAASSLMSCTVSSTTQVFHPALASKFPAAPTFPDMGNTEVPWRPERALPCYKDLQVLLPLALFLLKLLLQEMHNSLKLLNLIPKMYGKSI